MPLARQDSGVAQCCPGSGWLFAVAFNAPVRFAVDVVGSEGLLRACADDVAAACSGITVVGRLAAPLALIERAAGLAIHPRKTVVVPIIEASGFQAIAERVARDGGAVAQSDFCRSQS